MFALQVSKWQARGEKKREFIKSWLLPLSGPLEYPSYLQCYQTRNVQEGRGRLPMANSTYNDVQTSLGGVHPVLYRNCPEYSLGCHCSEWRTPAHKVNTRKAHLSHLYNLQLPQYMILTAKSYKATPVPRPSNTLVFGDFFIAALLVLNLTIQFIADQQQWDYQNYKRGRDSKERKLPDSVVKTLDQDPEVKRGFVTRGLWAYSRHPNFACEQTTWFVLEWWNQSLPSSDTFS